MKTWYQFKKILLYLPLVGVIAPLFYIIYAIISLKSFDIFHSDPKRFNIFNFYDFALYIHFIGTFSIPISVIFIVIALIKKQIRTIQKLDLLFFLIGTLLLISTYIFNRYSYIFWFFD